MRVSKSNMFFLHYLTIYFYSRTSAQDSILCPNSIFFTPSKILWHPKNWSTPAVDEALVKEQEWWVLTDRQRRTQGDIVVNSLKVTHTSVCQVSSTNTPHTMPQPQYSQIMSANETFTSTCNKKCLYFSFLLYLRNERT